MGLRLGLANSLSSLTLNVKSRVKTRVDVLLVLTSRWRGDLNIFLLWRAKRQLKATPPGFVEGQPSRGCCCGSIHAPRGVHRWEDMQPARPDPELKMDDVGSKGTVRYLPNPLWRILYP